MQTGQVIEEEKKNNNQIKLKIEAGPGLRPF